MRKLLLLVVAVAGAASASAHDLWLQLGAFALPKGGDVQLSVLVGHGNARDNWGVRSDRIIYLRNLAPNGQVTDLMPLIKPNTAAPWVTLRFAQPGTHVVVMQSSPSRSDLPAARFNAYLQEEGLTEVIAHRRKTGATGREGKEVYSRRAKALVHVGSTDRNAPSSATTRIGFALEIVPGRDPYLLRRNEALPVRVYYEGKPLAGALVKLTDLDADSKPTAMQRTDNTGSAQFRLPQPGKWMLNVVWSKPISGDQAADFQTIFSSLSFGYSGGAGA